MCTVTAEVQIVGILRFTTGLVQIRYISADVTAALAEIERNGITIFDVRAPDMLTLEFSMNHRTLPVLEKIANRRGDRLEKAGLSGIVWTVHALRNRYILITGILLILILGLLLPSRILFISVQGNNTVPSRQILEAAESAGLSFGAVRRAIRSEQIKNQLLDTVPDLKWAGVNTYGSRAVITVREREQPKQAEEAAVIRHIVAVCDGVITSCTVTEGSSNCTVGQAVREGDVLISGYTDCGLVIRSAAAEGTVMAATNRELTVKCPSDAHLRGSNGENLVRYSMNLGKKRINFFKGSGISDSSCVKMSMKYVLTLPGGFSLPVSFVRETISERSLISHTMDDAEQILETYAEHYLQTQMKSGTVIRKTESFSGSDGVLVLSGRYSCIEDIGMEQDEQIGDFHGKTDGTDRERRPGG